MDWLIVTNTVLALSLKVVNTVIHSIGLYLLRTLQRNGKGDENMIYLTSLSVSELLMNIVSFARNLLKILPYNFFKTDTFEDIIMYSYIGDYTVLKFCLYMTMMMMALDRMFLVLLNISYPLLWNRRKAKICIWLVWIAGISIFSTASIFYSQAESIFHDDFEQSNHTNISNDNENSTQEYTPHLSEEFKDLFFIVANRILIVFNLTFVATAVVSYGLIFHVFKMRHGSSKQSVWEVFKKSRFYVALLIILSNTLFIIPPDIIWTFVKDPDRAVQLYTTISYAIAYLSDGLFYIFMNDKVRRIFYKKIRKVARSRSHSKVSFIREISSIVEKKVPAPNRHIAFSHSENTTLFNEHASLHKDRNPHGGSVTTTTSASSVDMHGIGSVAST